MSEENKTPEGREEHRQEGRFDGARDAYQAFDSFVSVKDSDSTWLIAGKILLRLLGIAVMILLSPFLLIGLFIAFIAVF